MKIRTSIILLFYAVINVLGQTVLTIKDYPINTSPNPTIVVYDYLTGESKSFWNTSSNQIFDIPTKNNLLTNIIIYDQDKGSKSFFIRKGDSVIYNYITKEIQSLKYDYKPNDFKLTTISKSGKWKENIGKNNVSEDFIKIINLQSSLNNLEFIQIPQDFPRGLPAYRMKLYEYLNSKYKLSTKKTKDNVYYDYLKFFITIYEDSLIDKTTLSSYVFTKLNIMGTATTKEDFTKALLLFKQNSNDQNAIDYIENEYFLENKLETNTSIGIINGDKKQVKYDHLIKQNKGKYIVIDFWASWCAPCLISLPKSLELKANYHNDLEILYLSLDKNFHPWKNGERKFNIPTENSFLIVNGMQKDLQIDGLKISTIPRYFIYDRSGKLVNSNFEDIIDVRNFITNILK